MNRTLRWIARLFAAGSVALAVGSTSGAQPGPLDDTAARRAPDGFSASMLLTADADWRAKWNTPASTIPEFTRVESLPRGRKSWLLIFFANARTDASGNARIRCDIRFTRPDGKPAFEDKDINCFSGRTGAGARKVYLAAQNVEFVGDPTDPLGTWRVSVTVRDQQRGTELPLFTTFTLRER